MSACLACSDVSPAVRRAGLSVSLLPPGRRRGGVRRAQLGVRIGRWRSYMAVKGWQCDVPVS
eukprot:4156950-Prymnesium_polylepis.1